MQIRDGALALGIVVVGCGLVAAVTYQTPTKTAKVVAPVSAPKVHNEQEKVMKVMVTRDKNGLDVRLVSQ